MLDADVPAIKQNVDNDPDYDITIQTTVSGKRLAMVGAYKDSEKEYERDPGNHQVLSTGSKKRNNTVGKAVEHHSERQQPDNRNQLRGFVLASGIFADSLIYFCKDRFYIHVS